MSASTFQIEVLGMFLVILGAVEGVQAKSSATAAGKVIMGGLAAVTSLFGAIVLGACLWWLLKL